MTAFKLYNENLLGNGRIQRSYMMTLNKSLDAVCKVMNIKNFIEYEATITGYMLPNNLNRIKICTVEELSNYVKQYGSIMCNFMNGKYNDKSTDIQIDLETDMIYIESDSKETIENIIGELQ